MIAKKIVVVTVAWGDWHISQFLNLNLPTLMSQDNFPSLAKVCHIEYIIYTKKNDFNKLKTSKLIGQLGGIADLSYVFLDKEDLSDPIRVHHQCWDLATKTAEERGAYILLMPPDVAWSSNSFSYVAHELESGRAAIFMTYLRVDEQAFIRQFISINAAGHEGAVQLSGSQLVDMALKCLHPLMAAYLRNSSFFPRHPEMILWAVPGEGISCRLLAREMFIFDPSMVSLTANKLLATLDSVDDLAIVSDSDQLFGVSLAKLKQEIDWYSLPLGADVYSIGKWWRNYDSRISDLLVSKKIRWHVCPPTNQKWIGVETSGDLFLRKAALIREASYLLSELDGLEFSASSNILKYAVARGLLSKVIRGRSGGVVFVPTNTAFNKNSLQSFKANLAVQDSCVMTIIKAHFYGNRDIDQIKMPAKNQDVTELLEELGIEHISKSRDEIYVGSERAKIISGPIQVGHQIVFIIDRLLMADQPNLDFLINP